MILFLKLGRSGFANMDKINLKVNIKHEYLSSKRICYKKVFRTIKGYSICLLFVAKCFCI